MNFQQIRETFDKGNIAVSSHGLSVLYTIERFESVSQDFSNDRESRNPNAKRVFEKLIENTDSFGIHFLPGGKMRIDFGIDDDVDIRQPVWFLPLVGPISSEEIERLLNGGANSEACRRAIEFFRDFDLSDPDEGFLAVMEWEEAQNKRSGAGLSAETTSRWESLLESLTDFQSEVNVGNLEINEPTDDESGWVEYQIDAAPYIGVLLKGDQKLCFLKAVKLSSTVVFEAVNHNEPITYGNITFYS